MSSIGLYLADFLVIVGLLALSVGVYGVVKMPDIYTKLHAASKMVFLGMIPLLIAASLTGVVEITARAILVAALLLLTTPISTHAITKAAYRRSESYGATETMEPPDPSSLEERG